MYPLFVNRLSGPGDCRADLTRPENDPLTATGAVVFRHHLRLVLTRPLGLASPGEALGMRHANPYQLRNNLDGAATIQVAVD